MASTMRFDRWEDTLGNSVNMTAVSGGSGLVPIIPTSTAVGSGSATIGANGIVTFSGVTSISLNGCFTSAYQNYRIVLNLTTCTASTGLQFRLRAAGTDNSSSVYSDAGFYANNGGIANNSPTAQSTSLSGWTTTSTPTFVTRDISRPFATDWTNWMTAAVYQNPSTSQWYAGTHAASYSADGFTTILQTGNFSGTIQVYGYR